MKDIHQTLSSLDSQHYYFSLPKLAKKLGADFSKLPYSIRVLLEAALRECDEYSILAKDIQTIANWGPSTAGEIEIPFKPSRVVMQDFTGVPAVVDLATMRDAIQELGGDVQKVNPLIPVDLVIDHSIQVDKAGSEDALKINTALEFNRNQERYQFLKWGQETFSNFRVVPPATGIVHQVNLEYLATVVGQKQMDGKTILFPESLVGTDSHTTMINGIGVVGWGVGGIEAEAVMLGQPIYMLLPEVIGVELKGKLPTGATATDLVLTITQQLRKKGVVGKFVEFYGDGVKQLALADRATIANMAPEYGATMGFFPVDAETINFMRLSGRPDTLVKLTETYLKAQGLFVEVSTPIPQFSDTLSLDLTTIRPCIAGPKRPQDRVDLTDVKTGFINTLEPGYKVAPSEQNKQVSLKISGKDWQLHHGSVVLAAITSCTNTSNPSVMVGAGLLAKKAAALGLKVAPTVKTSLAPGSKVVTRYLQDLDLIAPLSQLGFQVVGYGCTTCIGNSGPLSDEVSEAIKANKLVVAGVLSGNRNFEGRVHPLIQANYLASPPLVVAYALAGRVDIDFDKEPLGTNPQGKTVFLKDIWPSLEEVNQALTSALKPEIFTQEYHDVFHNNSQWNAIANPQGERYAWNSKSTYIRKPNYFDGISMQTPGIKPVHNASVLAMLADSITTDHISPAGNIAEGSPAAQYLSNNGVQKVDWNSYGARRGNHEVMMRGTLANIRIKNELLDNVSGAYTKYLPTGEQMFIYDAAMKYQASGTPLIIIAGKEYGTGSSRDWAAKGVYLLGVKAAIAESFERIHRSNLIGMGIVPLQFQSGEDRKTLQLKGDETYSIPELNNDLKPGQKLKVTIQNKDGSQRSITVICRADTPVEIEYLKNGGILHTVLRNMAKS